MLNISAMPKYDSYRSTSIVWISELPQTWRIEKGKWLFARAERPVRSNDEIVTCFRDGTVTLRKNRRTEGFTNALKEHGYQGIRKGDLVIHAMDAFAGAIGVSDSDGKSTPVYAACIPRKEDEVNPEFYAYFLRDMALSGFITSLAKGIRERSTDFRFNDFADLELPAPSLDEQDRIAKFLDKKTTQIDEAIAIKEQQIALLKERKQIIIQKAVTQGLDPNVPMKDSGVDWIGEIPAHWDIKKIKHVSKKIGDGLHGTPVYDDLGEFYFINGNNLGRDEISITEKTRTVSRGEWNRHKKDLGGWTLLLSINGTIGNVSKYNFEKVMLGKSAAYINFHNNIYVDFMLTFLRSSSFRKYYELELSGSTIWNLSLFSIAKAKVAFPPRSEQESIVEYVKNKSTEIEVAIRGLNTQIEKLKEYKTTLINSAVTGKIKITPDMVED